MWCSGRMVGKFIGDAMASSFRRETGYKGKLRVDIYDRDELIARET